MTIPRELTAALVNVAAVFAVAGLFFSPAAGKAMPETPQSPPKAQIRGAGRDVSGPTVRLLLDGGETRTLPLEDYVYGVLGGEMPALWPMDALKAQAVCARTYALYQRQAGKHAAQEADICGDSTCCQAYQTPAFLQDTWGSDAPFYEAKLRQAVAETQGQVVTYQGALISALYHASSVGTTNAAETVWGRAVPYLVSVDTPGDLSKGHGVGMSQWGARYMAEDGATYQDILAHYYPGTSLEAF